jgi:hypothetical protein
MIIKLNDKDIHGAIRGFLQQQNIIDNYARIDIALTVGRGKNAGVSAEITIIDTTNGDTDESLGKLLPKEPSLFGDDHETHTTEES